MWWVKILHELLKNSRLAHITWYIHCLSHPTSPTYPSIVRVSKFKDYWYPSTSTQLARRKADSSPKAIKPVGNWDCRWAEQTPFPISGLFWSTPYPNHFPEYSRQTFFRLHIPCPTYPWPRWNLLWLSVPSSSSPPLLLPDCAWHALAVPVCKRQPWMPGIHTGQIQRHWVWPPACRTHIKEYPGLRWFHLIRLCWSGNWPGRWGSGRCLPNIIVWIQSFPKFYISP